MFNSLHSRAETFMQLALKLPTNLVFLFNQEYHLQVISVEGKSDTAVLILVRHFERSIQPLTSYIPHAQI